MTTVIVIVTRRVSLRPSPVRDITLHTTLNIIGVTSTTGLSVVKRVQGVIKVKGKGVYSSSWNSLQNYGTPLVNGITQCYLPPDRGDRPAFTPTGQVGTGDKHVHIPSTHSESCITTHAPWAIHDTFPAVVAAKLCSPSVPCGIFSRLVIDNI